MYNVFLYQHKTVVLKKVKVMSRRGWREEAGEARRGAWWGLGQQPGEGWGLGGTEGTEAAGCQATEHTRLRHCTQCNEGLVTWP